ncbi:MAG: hypothetical protein DRG83_21525 [Deltaproteobacteria bacterium]|nr:MAG: hypothetical protein DRG83_21525 [Deltaproteobacteria bacterium]
MKRSFFREDWLVLIFLAACLGIVISVVGSLGSWIIRLLDTNYWTVFYLSLFVAVGCFLLGKKVL